MKKYKVDLYKIRNKGRTLKILVFPKLTEEAWAYDDYPEESQLMLDGSISFMRQVQVALAALIEDPSVIAYFPIKNKNCTRFGRHMTFDAVLLRPELQFKLSEWYDIKDKLDRRHWVGKYKIRHHERQLVDLWKKEYQHQYWKVAWDRKNEKLIGDTVFLVLPKSVCLEYHYDISDSAEEYSPNDDYGTFAGIGYIIPPPKEQKANNKQQ